MVFCVMQILSGEGMYQWLDEIFLPHYFAQKSYTNETLSWRERRFLTDGPSFRVGPTRIRQLRTEPSM